MNTVLPKTRAADPGTCAAWCHDHDDLCELCGSETVVVNVADAPATMLNSFRGRLAQSEDGLSVMLGLDNDWFDTDIDTAEAIATALLHLVGLARAGAATIPAPRAGGAR